MSYLILSCIVFGQDAENIFPVKILPSKTVGELKDLIKTKMSPLLDAYPASMLELYKVSVPDGPGFHENIAMQLENNSRLSGVRKLEGFLSDSYELKQDHVHIVVKPPAEAAVLGASLSQNKKLSLNCYVIGDKGRNNIFAIDIDASRKVASLKHAIKAENNFMFHGVDAKTLELWHVSVEVDLSFEEKISSLRLVDEEALLPIVPLAEIFSEPPPANCVHILVRNNFNDIESNDIVTGLPESRNYDMIVADKGETPSVGAKSKEYVKIQAKENEAIHDGRHPDNPAFSTVAPPVQIFHPVFEKFLQLVNNPSVTPSKRDHILAQEFMHLLSAISPTKISRNDIIRKKLTEILEVTINDEGNLDQTSADGVYILQLNCIRIAILIMELKKELGDGSCDPSTQAGLSMRRSWIADGRKEIRDKCCCPTFMIAGGGAWLSVLGGVITDKVIVQRLTNMMWVANSSTQEDLRVHRFARVLSALRECLPSLRKYYEDVSDPKKPPRIPDQPHPRYYPYRTSFPENGKDVQFEYTRKLEDDSTCVTFLAKILDAADSPDIVVKFTHRYGKEVHDFLAEENHAPKLRYCGPLYDAVGQLPPSPHGLSFGPMLMVVMEYVSDCKVAPTNANEQVRAVLFKLHARGYVFGDLRRQNVLFEKGKVKFIDFDWAGRYDMNVCDESLPVGLQNAINNNNEKNQPDCHYVCYPLNLSKSIVWAEGAKDLEPIRPQHDWAMLHKLF